MTHEPPADPPPGDESAERPQVGSLGEEAAELFAALVGIAREQGGQYAGAAAGAAADAVHNLNDHLATGAPECSYCPVCQAIHVVRSTSPEVRAHLADAAGSVLQAVAGLLATQVSRPGSRGDGADGDGTQDPPVQHIDLDEDAVDDPGASS